MTPKGPGTPDRMIASEARAAAGLLARVERCWTTQDGTWRVWARLVSNNRDGFIGLSAPREIPIGSQVRVVSTASGWRLAEGG